MLKLGDGLIFMGDILLNLFVRASSDVSKLWNRLRQGLLLFSKPWKLSGLMIDFIQVTKRFGTQEVLVDVSFRINAGEHVGIVGPNGAGKSTVFGLISGETSTDSGDVTLPKNVRLGHLHQQLHSYAQTDSLIDYATDSIPELKTIHAEIHELEHRLEKESGSGQMLERLGELQHEYEHLGGYAMRARAEAALSGLGFKEAEFNNPFQSFSGGWQMRAELVRTLIAQPDVLMLDEPSNYLDLPAVEWLQRFLRGFSGTMLLISHDRYLLESLTDRTLEIQGGSAVKYAGGYSYYVKEREQRHLQQAAEYRNYVEKKEQLESFINRFRAKSTKAAQVQSRVKMLEKMDAVRMPPKPPQAANLRIAPPPRCGAQIMQLENLGFSYDGERWIFRDVNLDIQNGQKIAIVGYNGMGKTTLLRVIAGTLQAGEGRLREGHKVVLGYQSQDFAETMPPDKTVLGVVRDAGNNVSERDVRGLLGSFGFSGDSVDKQVAVLSGGEKIRLAFARIFINPPNFLLLDEPTTHLDIQGREGLEKAIREYPGTVCLVSHDVSFVRGAADHIVEVRDGCVSSFPGGYDYYLEKTAGQETIEGRKTKVQSPDNVQPSAANPKAARAERAKMREAQKGLRRMEAEMETLQAAQQELHQQMASGNPELDYAVLNIQLSELTQKLTALEARWLEEADRLEG
ncbi:ABC-F family ATP-binding cassette domain-containing protein [Tichowtungia aerotolerans]|uniref:ATP-binding cassette domain-containing protein n=1 Tax=Tichowtungia aerotolerans TaxID=2697043 RepID=A0A6P1M7I3_9BACT|nr:ABC-F family ATP-binding cassette domain-containing protein [Tichowtungia aerotolerans]QHI70699.1 ATP-binding cassette domain-containing protein [Tichowtungia aerotolerans]